MNNDYCDINRNWNLNSNGDLILTDNYQQSVEERLNCPLGYLRYYNDYGSDILESLGKKYQEEEVRLKLEQAFKQDININKYHIDKLTFNKGTVTVYCTINSMSMNFIIGEEVIE